MISADHGEELWDHGRFFHGQSLYDELLHVPLLVRLPGGRVSGTVVDQIVRSVDILPTIATTLDLPPDSGTAGEPLVDRAGAAAVTADREVFAHAANPAFPQRFAVRTRRHKLIVSVEDGSEELFDLARDPGERTNLAATPEAAAALAKLRSRLLTYRRPLRERDFQVRAVATDGRPHAIEVLVETPGGIPLSDPDRIDLPAGDRVVLARDARSLRWTGTVGGNPAGIRFEHGGLATPGSSDRLTLRVLVDGVPAPPDAIRLGARGERPISPLIDYAAGTPDLAADAPPSLVGGGTTVLVGVWRENASGDHDPAHAIISPDDRERLRALGYAE